MAFGWKNVRGRPNQYLNTTYDLVRRKFAVLGHLDGFGENWFNLDSLLALDARYDTSIKS